MKKVSYCILFFGATLLFCSESLAIDFDTTFRSNFTDLLLQECSSSWPADFEDVDTILDVSFEEVRAHVNQKISCAIDDAFISTAETANNIVKETFKDFEPTLSLFPSLGSGCTEGGNTNPLQSLYQRQKNLPFYEHLCETEDVYSPDCINEILWNEMCGYHLYLWAKGEDTVSFKETAANTSRRAGVGFDETAYKKEFQEEAKVAEVSLTRSLELYQQFSMEYQLDQWLEATHQQIYGSKQLLDQTRTMNTIYEIYLSKFPEATANSCQ